MASDRRRNPPPGPNSRAEPLQSPNCLERSRRRGCLAPVLGGLPEPHGATSLPFPSLAVGFDGSKTGRALGHLGATGRQLLLDREGSQIMPFCSRELTSLVPQHHLTNPRLEATSRLPGASSCRGREPKPSLLSDSRFVRLSRGSWTKWCLCPGHTCEESL
jgi:hypothetical protein